MERRKWGTGARERRGTESGREETEGDERGVGGGLVVRVQGERKQRRI